MTFGQWVVNSQQAIKPDFFGSPHIWQVLFHPWHGLFLWHPATLIALIGLVWYAVAVKEHRVITLSCLAIFALQVVVNSTPWTWWSGGAFGGRRFCDVLPLLAVGLAFIVSRYKVAVPLLVVLAYWNIGLLWAWSPSDSGRYAPYGNLISPVEPLTMQDVREVSGVLLLQQRGGNLEQVSASSR
jgi:hypothetical protein